MEELDNEEKERKDSPRFSQADSSLLYPASLSPAPDPLSHLGSLLAGGWDRRADQSYQSCQLPGREAHADQSVTILHAKVAQKSYGNEKRFFCPPPCVYIGGPGWRVMQNHLKAAGHGDAVYRVCGFLCLDNTSHSQADAYKLMFNEQPNSRSPPVSQIPSMTEGKSNWPLSRLNKPPNSSPTNEICCICVPMFASAKSLFISDQDKRKHFCLLLRLFLGNRQEVGSFQSRMIKVISKPSQKRQSMKNADREVALFNRLRSQTVSTRYLSVDRGAFIASAKQWTAFTIMLAEAFFCSEFLQRSVSRGGRRLREARGALTLTLNNLPSDSVIRKVNKQHAFLDVDEPVSQLHKCAFQFRHDPNALPVLIQRQHRAAPVGLNDGSCWTIIGVEVVEFTFNQGSSCILTPVTPFPFNLRVRVWFGNSEAETMFKSPQSLLCVVPDISVFSDGWRCLRRVLTVPLALIRSDGLIYRTSFSFTYTPEIKPPPSRGTSGGGKREGGTEGGQQEDVLLETIHQEFTRANFHLFIQS
ncbi:hypothetical protein KUCAC02_016853 [Chaenocephalus aceratus]|nr:hypothetical protein KUCAC02_016853 [Chaenocephalus aceratus]